MHNITSTDGVFSVREPMWHSLGTVLDDYPTREEVERLVFPWEPVAEPIYRRETYVVDHGFANIEFQDRYSEVEGERLIARSDSGAPLGVVRDSYQLVTNRELLDIAEQIESSGSDVRYETGGSLKGGAKVWLLLRLAEPIVLKGDPNGAVLPYYALQNDHTGAGTLRGQGIMTRIVCDNTSRAADLEAAARGTEFAFRHSGSITQRVEEAKTALAGWRESIEQWHAYNEHLINLRVSLAQRDEFIERFIAAPPAGTVSERVLRNVEEARGTLRSILASETCADVDLTAYGLVQAAIEYAQHARAARSIESRFRRAYLDRSEITTSAVRIAESVALS